MELIFYIIITWFVIACFVTILPESELTVSIVLYMILLIVTVSISTVISLNLKLIDFTDDKTKFLAVVLNRNIVVPMILVIFSNIFSKLKTSPRKSASVIIMLIFIAIIEFINLQFHLYSYIRWNFISSLVLSTFYVFIAIRINKWLYGFQQRGKLCK